MTRHSADTLAEWAASVSISDLPSSACLAARRATLDLIGAAVAGVGLTSATAVCRYVSSAFRPGEATVWFTPHHTVAPGAAFANSAAASALDIDDGHRRASGHPGAAVIPAALAVGEEQSASGLDVLAAIVVGYELAIRAGAAFKLGPDDPLLTGHWCSVGAAAAAGRLRGLSRHHLASALGTAASLAPHLVNLGSSYARHIKEGIPWSAHAGLVAVELAGQGFAGPPAAFDEGRYLVDVLVDGLGRDAPLIETAYTKPYASCRWSHAAIDASIELARTHNIGADAIEAITIDTFAPALTLYNEVDPGSLEAAQYSIPFCVAASLVRGPSALVPLRRELLGDHDVIELARRVRLRVDPKLDAMFPEKVAARVTLETRRGSSTQLVDTPLGDPVNPMSREGLIAKFRALTDGIVDEGDADELIDAVDGLDAAPTVRQVTTVLQRG